MALESIMTDINKEQWEDKMYILQYQNADYHLNTDLIKESLYDYIHSINRKDKCKRFFNSLPDTVYGLATYDKVIEYLNYLLDGDDSFMRGLLLVEMLILITEYLELSWSIKILCWKELNFYQERWIILRTFLRNIKNTKNCRGNSSLSSKISVDSGQKIT